MLQFIFIKIQFSILQIYASVSWEARLKFKRNSLMQKNMYVELALFKFFFFLVSWKETDFKPFYHHTED